MALFRKKKDYIRISPNREEHPKNQPSVPDNLWAKCPNCKKTIYTKEIGLEKSCPNCGYHFRLNAWQRLAITVDKKSFIEFDTDLVTKDPLQFPNYQEKISQMAKQLINYQFQ